MKDSEGELDRSHSTLDRPLRIGIDARGLLRQRTGVERMTFHLVESLGRVDGNMRIILFVDQPLTDARFGRAPYEIVVEPIRRRWGQRLFDVWLTWQLRGAISACAVDVFCSPHTKFPFSSIPRFTTVHGLEWYHYSAGYGRLEWCKQWFWFRLARRFSRGMVTFAQNTLNDILTLCPAPLTPICVVPEGVSSTFRRLTESEQSQDVLEKHRIVGPYVLSVCSLEPRKNMDGLIRAFAILVREHGIGHQLVLVGRAGRQSEVLTQLIESHGLENRVCLTGYLGDDDLVQLYNQAEVFVYPSKYEGFGLPLLEAMACGSPVVTSNGSSLREVAGSAAELVDPASDRSMATGIHRVISDPVRRRELIMAGLERVTYFSWDEMARRIFGFVLEHSGRISRSKTSTL